MTQYKLLLITVFFTRKFTKRFFAILNHTNYFENNFQESFLLRDIMINFTIFINSIRNIISRCIY